MNIKQIIVGSIQVLIVLLTVLFTILKLCNVLAWSWLWVLAPLWIPILFILIVTLILPALLFLLVLIADD